MRVALVNPCWTFAGSIYFGCREPHLPLELGYAKAMLEQEGHATLMLDGHLFDRDDEDLIQEIDDFLPDMTVVTTAPSYLFWRCAPPELRVPAQFLRTLGQRGGRTVAVGPHGSVTPASTLRKLQVDAVVRGECEGVIAALACADDWRRVPSIAWLGDDDRLHTVGALTIHPFASLPPLTWPDAWIARHHHHHHRFDMPQEGRGAEVEASRGCPYSCSFCAKNEYRDAYRRRDLAATLAEIDRLIEQGVRYIYFIDEIFLPQKPLLEALVTRKIQFGVQTRIDLWKPDLLELLGNAGCVSIEAGIESLTVKGREALAKRCRLETEELAQLLFHARQHVPFVQANLIGTAEDSEDQIAYWRDRLISGGVWANEPVPLYPYPSSPEYHALWGEPDDFAWERAQDHYLAAFSAFSDIQEEQPVPLQQLERQCFRMP
jgi:B12-binding domain/radical SAM domain protein of rhizo-twelve system